MTPYRLRCLVLTSTGTDASAPSAALAHRRCWLLGLLVLAVSGCEGFAASLDAEGGWTNDAGAPGGAGGGGSAGTGGGMADGTGGGGSANTIDSGVHIPDAGGTTHTDAGVAEDGGHADAGSPDAGAVDAGPNSATDAGPPSRPSWVPASYQLVWADEFDGAGPLPDSSKWDYDTAANKTGWYNNELEYYSAARAENSRVAGGRLTITGRKERATWASDYGAQSYTSARLITRGKASWTYGFIDVRAKMPGGNGSWPAIWMLGTGGAWPGDGEIDIMEQVGMRATTIYGTVHCQATAGTSGNGSNTQVGDACSAFHDYTLEWTKDFLSFGVDGHEYHRYTNPHTGHDAWPFDAPQYLLLNLAIGGDMAGGVDDSIFPIEFQVEYARVYQKP